MGHHVSILGVLAFVALFAIGLVSARILQSETVRRFFARFKLDPNFVATVRTILSLAALVFFPVTAINAAGVPLLWTAPVPGVSLSLVQMFLLIALLIAVFWFSSRTKRFLFNRFLVNSGLPTRSRSRTDRFPPFPQRDVHIRAGVLPDPE